MVGFAVINVEGTIVKAKAVHAVFDERWWLSNNIYW